MAVEFIALKLAEAVVSQVIQRISDLLIHEVSSFRGVREDIENLQKELKWMQGCLKDADRKQERDEFIHIWIAEVRDIACEIEDAIETYVYKVHSSYIKAFHLRKLRAHINSIKRNLQSIRERKATYQIEFHSGDQAVSSLTNRRRTHPDEEEDVITLKNITTTLKDQLMKEEDQCCVVSIVGMGGLGKTTLAKRVYNDVDIKNQFDCCAWVFISQQYMVREVLSEILLQVGFQSNQPKQTLGSAKYTKEFLQERKNQREILRDMEDHELVELLKIELKEKRYLIVLDDIWTTDAWNDIKSAFPDGRSGSKVMLTTRKREVASYADPNRSPIEPPLLTPQESWELLQRKAFPNKNFKNGYPSEFEELGKEIVAACDGLPLAIVVLGGLLRTKTSLDQWKEVHKDVKSKINKLKSEQSYKVEDILDLSFQELPYNLKPCFLYLGSFPEDSERPKRRLIRLWCAEGFVSEDAKGTSLDDIAEQYLGELIDRCMVQVEEKDNTGKGVKTLRLHDLMRDFCVSKAKNEAFLAIKQKNENNMAMVSSSSVVESRRIAIHVNHDLGKNEMGQIVEVHPRLRTLLYFGEYEFPNSSSVKNNAQLLRVLDLNCAPRKLRFSFSNLIHLRYLRLGSKDLIILPQSLRSLQNLQTLDLRDCVPRRLPFSISNLIHLRYLRLGRGDFLILPQSLSSLQNLRTLDLRGCYFAQLPCTMKKLINLRHLLLPQGGYLRPRWAVGPLFGKDTFAQLETLKNIDAKDLIRHNFVPPMTRIQALHIRRFRSSEEVSLVIESLNFYSRLSHLRSFTMEMKYFGLSFPRAKLFSACCMLSKLNLSGKLFYESFLSFPTSITKLILEYSDLNQEKMEVLEKLPNLRILQLIGDSTIVKWVCSFNGFPKLEFLKLDGLFELEEWEVAEGAMPNLKILEISFLLKLRMIPEGLKHVTTLRELSIEFMTKKFTERVKRVNECGVEGEDFYKVTHVPSITFSNMYR